MIALNDLNINFSDGYSFQFSNDEIDSYGTFAYFSTDDAYFQYYSDEIDSYDTFAYFSTDDAYFQYYSDTVIVHKTSFEEQEALL